MRLVFALALTCAAAFAATSTASAAPGVRYGIQDDAWLLHGPGTLNTRLDTLSRLGVDVVRFNLQWDKIEPRRGRPNWTSSDAVLKGLRSRRIGAVVGLVGSPRWANGGRGPNWAPRAALFATFARTAARRYSWVRDWLIWNEPNQSRWLRPTAPSLYVRALLNPAYTAIHRVKRSARVAGGVTAPRAGSAGVSPVDWIRGMAKSRPKLDAYAHHPYPARPTDSPFAGGCTRADCKTITMANIERLLNETARAFGPKRIWLTEYAYQTGRFGVSKQRQAELIGQGALRVLRTPRVDMLIHYLVRDEPAVDRFQSGLFSFAMRAKPAALAFPFPLAQAGRASSRLVLWGQVRPRTGAQTFRLQVRSGGTWRWSGGTRRTSKRGFFSVAVPARKGAQMRIWSPRDAAFSAAIIVR